ncbi:hypothetical protein A3Q56_03873, partial [Intoshia linei]
RINLTNIATTVSSIKFESEKKLVNGMKHLLEKETWESFKLEIDLTHRSVQLQHIMGDQIFNTELNVRAIIDLTNDEYESYHCGIYACGQYLGINLNYKTFKDYRNV